ncbi:hypothetical protein GH714_025243 [Hevea brasiliensis]|uniref:Clp R domain-containing protein n=1 Tax=Hevea brasiliensis TaxID=3981 RepID=A0A6A6MD67_HEVBR|nr:hypothetical protein GH714_025243 [Hevea brasiliensis]
MVFTQHLLLGLIGEDRDPNGFLGSGLKIDKAREVVRNIWSSDADADDANASASSTQRGGGGGTTSSTDVPFSISTKRVFEVAVEYSRTMGYNFIAPEHMAVGLFTVDDGSATRVLKRLGANVDHLAAVAVTRLQGELAKDGRELSVESKGSREKSFSKKAAALRSSEKTREKSALTQFCVDLTARASEGLMTLLLAERLKLKELFRYFAAEPKTILFFLAKRVMSLDMGLLIAGAKERGELEARVTALIGEILKEGNIILFIDEVHTLVGTGTVGRGNKGSGLDIANLLKPSLGGCMASTTIDEYRTHFESDKALARRFQPVSINEPNQEDAVKILLGLRQKYEAHHNCIFTPEAINAAVYLSARYIADRYLPDKAIDLIDEAGSRARIEAHRKKKNNRPVLASKVKNDGSTCNTKDSGEIILEAHVPVTSDDDDEPIVVGPDDIAAVASLWSGIPVQHSLLMKECFWPIAAMMFCGPTGVGKTELAKALAACYFGSESAMLRLDMSEYMERHTVSKLIGSPPGYVGYGEGGTLTEAIRRQPFTLVLLDEIEKAHPDVFNMLLQLFEDGHLTDSQMLKILNLMLQEVKERLISLGIGLEVSESIKDLVCQQGYDKIYGARPLRRAVTQIIENPISEALLAGGFKPGDTAIVDLDASGNPALLSDGAPDAVLAMFFPVGEPISIQKGWRLERMVKGRVFASSLQCPEAGSGAGCSRLEKEALAEGGVGKSSDIDARGLLLLIGCYGIPKGFTNEDIWDLIRLSNSKQIADALRRSPVLVARVSGILERMMNNGMKIEAVDVAYTFGIEDKFPPQKLLTSFLRDANEASKRRRREANNSPYLLKEASEKQLTALKSVIKLLEDRKLDPIKLLPGWQLIETRDKLEKEIADLNKKIEDRVTQKRKADENEFSNNLKSHEKKRLRFTGSPLISSPRIGLHEQRATGHVEGSGLYGWSWECNAWYWSGSCACNSIPSTSSFAGVHRDMLVDRTGQKMSRNVAYGWHGVGDPAFIDFSREQSFVHQPASGLFGPSPSIEGFVGVSNSPPTNAANRSSTSDLYRFADAVK